MNTKAFKAAQDAGCAECGRSLTGPEPIEDGLTGIDRRTGDVKIFCSRNCADLHIPERARYPRCGCNCARCMGRHTHCGRKPCLARP